MNSSAHLPSPFTGGSKNGNSDYTDMHNDDILHFLLARKHNDGSFVKQQLLLPLREFALFTIGLFGAGITYASCELESKAYAVFKTDMIAAKGDSIVWRVTGRMTDRKTGKGIGDARISVQHNDIPAGEEELMETTVDRNGNFELIIPAADTDETFTFRVSGPGYAVTTVKNVNPASGKLDLRLKKQHRNERYATGTWASF